MVKILVGLEDAQAKADLKRDAHAHQMAVNEYIRWLIEKEREKHGN